MLNLPASVINGTSFHVPVVLTGGTDVAAWVGAARLGGNWVGLLAAQAAISTAVISPKMNCRRMALIIMRGPVRPRDPGGNYDASTLHCPAV